MLKGPHDEFFLFILKKTLYNSLTTVLEAHEKRAKRESLSLKLKDF
jgi:hypothetical protein